MLNESKYLPAEKHTRLVSIKEYRKWWEMCEKSVHTLGKVTINTK